ncbi:MAG: TetR/AcrR family transcriptional regulator [Verrucomicrobia subdivision 3 bacterium]|nr:TetR/AcrR family transcriptional regulator [Verrucomicrobiales bacterium]MCI0745515.1 TetR/AcrR family transcriptional regulator [Limisphaerales bacterium]
MSPRRKEFSKEVAVERAVDAFWEHGFHGASMEVLVRRTGVNRFSLYGTFGDKRGLFEEACRSYTAKMFESRVSLMEGKNSAMDSIEAFFESAIGPNQGAGKEKGCLMTNSIIELALHDKAFRKMAEVFLNRLEAAFRNALGNAKKRGEIRPDCHVADLAAHLTCLTQGVGVLVRSGKLASDLKSVIKKALEMMR